MASDRKVLAPAPRLTLWVPALVAGAMSVAWGALWAVFWPVFRAVG